MENLSRNKLVLIMALSELAFLIPAIPLYIFLVLPNHPAGNLPGMLPLIGAGASVPISILAALITLVAALLFAGTLYRFFGNSHFYNKEMLDLADQLSERDFIPIYLAAGIGEEALFRLALIEPCGIVVSSLLFTALHVAYWRKPLMLVYVFVAGVLFGALYLFTESILLCIIVHAAFNTAASILLKRKLITPRG